MSVVLLTAIRFAIGCYAFASLLVLVRLVSSKGLFRRVASSDGRVPVAGRPALLTFNTPNASRTEHARSHAMSDRTNEQLLRDAREIWQAGVAAVDSSRLEREVLTVVDGRLQVGEESFDRAGLGRIIVVGCGKAGAGMAAGVEEALGSELAEAKQLTGWVNVPADCVRSLPHIHLHGARPAGRNEPTAEGIEGSEQILKLVSAAAADDLVICLISGGGSALRNIAIHLSP